MSVEIHEESNLVQHAKRELKATGEGPDIVKPTLEIISIFSQMGHSDMSAAIYIQMLDQLLNFKNLTPLTNDPEEWVHHGEDVWDSEGGFWQNRRNGEAFSNDGGETYYLLSEGRDGRDEHIMHTSEKADK